MVSSDRVDVVGIMAYNGGEYEMVTGPEALDVIKNIFIETSTLANMKFLECLRYFGPEEKNNTKGTVDTRCFINLSNVESIHLMKGR